ncbi:MAG: hypothetical protein Q9196_007305, partial [Gyalolechia fulgens]
MENENRHDLIRLLRNRELLTTKLSEHPYSFVTYSERAQCHEELGYPDLAIGDAYRMLLLIDEISDVSGEYHEEASDALREDFGDGDSTDEEDDNPFISVIDKHRLLCFASLSRLLLECGCLRSAYDFAERGLRAAPRDATFLSLRSHLLNAYNAILLENDRDRNELLTRMDPRRFPEQGYARRELYPWNNHEPDRFSEDTLCVLNQAIKRVAPKSEIRAVSLPLLEQQPPEDPSKPSATIEQLGIFATEDIAPQET